jgi:hypothetical protein
MATKKSAIESELRRQIRDLRLAVRFQAETIRLLAERIPPQKPIADGKDGE